MEFNINEGFAKQYNEYRENEEYQKLKSRYGDVKLKKKKSAITENNGEQSDESSSSSSSSSSEDEEFEELEHEDFLNVFDALCSGNAALEDKEKVWFRPRPTKEQNEKAESDEPVLLKDHTREFLLSHGGMEDEKQAAKSKSLSRFDLLEKMKDKQAMEQKTSFLA